MGFHTNCESATRRDCLRLGLGALIGGGLIDALRLRGQAALAGPRPSSCILIWMDGGPSHYETFDPKPGAPKEIRGEFSPIATAVPGVFFSEPMKRLASIADKLAIVRSICHNQGNHGAGNHYMMTGAPTRIPVGCGAFVSFHPSLGSVTAHERGSTGGMPPYFSMPSMSRSGGPNFLGAKYAPFVVPDDPNRDAFQVRDVAPPRGLDDHRFDRRRDLRARVDRFRRFTDQAACDPAMTLDAYYEQGYDLMSSPDAQRAFNIGNEPDMVRDAYGRNSFGQRALLARRLVEAGVPFVTLNEGGWDHHIGIFKALQATHGRLRIDDRRADPGPRPARLARDDAGHRAGRVRPHAQDQQGCGPRPLVERHVGPVRRWRHARRPGRRLDRRPRLRRQRAGPRSGELRRHGLHQARHRPGQDPPHTQRPAGPTGERPDPDPGTDGMTRCGVVMRTSGRRLVLRLGAAVLVAALVGPARSSAKPPTLTELFPPGAGRGQSVAVNASGTFDHWPVKAWIEGRGVEIRAEKEKGKLTAVVAADAPPGLRWVRLYDEEGATALRPFVIGVLARGRSRSSRMTSRRPRNASASLRPRSTAAWPRRETWTVSRST